MLIMRLKYEANADMQLNTLRGYWEWAENINAHTQHALNTIIAENTLNTCVN